MSTNAIHHQCSDNNFAEAVSNTLIKQGNALLLMTEKFDRKTYQNALELMYMCKGHVIICGIGKSGHVGRKLSATPTSNGTPSFFLHPAEAFHGDLGMITTNDVVILISNSGETDEILKLIPSLKSFDSKIIAITSGQQSTIAKNADITLIIQLESECCPNNLAPTTSTTITMAIGDALSVALMCMRNFKPQDFARYHLGGSLGRRLLTKVKDIMQTNVPAVSVNASFRDVVTAITKGCQELVIVLNDTTQSLEGIITDGDLRRAMEKHHEFTEYTAKNFMTDKPVFVKPDMMMNDAEKLMTEKRISSLLVSDDEKIVMGLIRIFD